MKVLIIRQNKSIYNQQDIKKYLTKFVDKSDFSIKSKGKRSFSIFFKESINTNLVNKISRKMGFEITYQSEVRCILSDKIDY